MTRRPVSIALSIAVFVFWAQLARPDAVYNVTLNTTSLAGHAAGPFSLEFQLTDGSGTNDRNNTAIMSNFGFGGGASAGAPILTGGSAGGLDSFVAITDSSFLNQFIQQFTPGNQLSFTLALTTNVDSGGIPDQFTMSILDQTGAELPTTSTFDVFLAIDINSSNPGVRTFSSDASRAPAAGGGPVSIEAPVLSEVPEPGSLVLVGGALMLVLLTRLRRLLLLAHRSCAPWWMRASSMMSSLMRYTAI